MPGTCSYRTSCISTTGLRSYSGCGGLTFSYTNTCNERLYVKLCWLESNGRCLCEGGVVAPGRTNNPWTCNPNGRYRLWAYPESQIGTCQPPDAC
jgi:hypothetical protein